MRAEDVPVARLERERAELLAAIAERLRDRVDAGVVRGADGHAERHDAVLGIGTPIVVHGAHGIGQCTERLAIGGMHEASNFFYRGRMSSTRRFFLVPYQCRIAIDCGLEFFQCERR